MVLVDADGNKIQAAIKKEHLQKLQSGIKKGEWRIFDEFSVKKATGMYRPTTHNYRIVFEYSTVISPSETISESIWLDLVPFNSVLSGTLDQNKLPSDGLALTIMEPKPRFQPLKVREERSKQFPRKTIAELKASLEIIWRCDKCNTNVSSVEARYWLHLDVMDNTGESKLMLFDSFVEQIIGIPACDLVDPTTEELDDPLPLPDVVKNIIGKTYQFALCVEQDNISRGNDEYKVSEVLTSQNLNHPALEPEVDYPVDLSSMSSSDQVLMLTNSSHHDDTTNTSLSTPSSKRKEDTSDRSDQNSTSKKQCTGTQSDVKDNCVIDLDTPEKNDQSTDVKVDGVIAVDNSKEHDQPKFIHKLDEAGQEAINKVAEAEQKKVLLKKIKVEKLEGQKGAK
ncbi:predicted protein [Arabidopsis lyrata subsp. lyrata]|uniref:Predicted protein n=1 Tax=Arabidopsis lyrata subsp. lyrata TaxID=81972 RepID=D7LFG0_ARALL|nr:predicted protein [Arabidopsis lyrata subsp. lyrata]